MLESYKGKETMKMKIALLIFLSQIGSAFALTYNESEQGDITSYPGFDFDLGYNLITGAASIKPNFESDFDIFHFSIPDGSFVKQVTLEWQVTHLSDELLGAEYHSLVIHFKEKSDFINSPNPTSINFIANPFGQTDIDISHLPLTDAYQWRYDVTTCCSISNGDSDWNYQLAINVSPVPIPASLYLFLTGLLTLGASKKYLSKA